MHVEGDGQLQAVEGAQRGGVLAVVVAEVAGVGEDPGMDEGESCRSKLQGYMYNRESKRALESISPS